MIPRVPMTKWAHCTGVTWECSYRLVELAPS